VVVPILTRVSSVTVEFELVLRISVLPVEAVTVELEAPVYNAHPIVSAPPPKPFPELLIVLRLVVLVPTVGSAMVVICVIETPVSYHKPGVPYVKAAVL